MLSLKKVNPRLVQLALDQLKEPEMPKVFIEDKETWEENPADPDYEKALTQYNIKRGTLIQDLYLARGTEIKQIPSSVSGPETEEWIEEAEFLGITVKNKDSKIARYAQWLYFNIDIIEELQALVMASHSYNNLLDEEQVLEMMRSFRHPEGAIQHPDGASTEETEHTNNVPEPSTRDSERVRTEGSSPVLSANVDGLPQAAARPENSYGGTLPHEVSYRQPR